ISPAFMKEEFARQYENLQEWHWWFRGRQRILESVLSHEMKQQPKLRIVSLGSGPGSQLRWLASYARNGFVVGIDTERTHASKQYPSIYSVAGKIEAAPLASQKFDAVL